MHVYTESNAVSYTNTQTSQEGWCLSHDPWCKHCFLPLLCMQSCGALVSCCVLKDGKYWHNPISTLTHVRAWVTLLAPWWKATWLAKENTTRWLEEKCLWTPFAWDLGCVAVMLGPDMSWVWLGSSLTTGLELSSPRPSHLILDDRGPLNWWRNTTKYDRAVLVENLSWS